MDEKPNDSDNCGNRYGDYRTLEAPADSLASLYGYEKSSDRVIHDSDLDLRGHGTGTTFNWNHCIGRKSAIALGIKLFLPQTENLSEYILTPPGSGVHLSSTALSRIVLPFYHFS